MKYICILNCYPNIYFGGFKNFPSHQELIQDVIGLLKVKDEVQFTDLMEATTQLNRENLTKACAKEGYCFKRITGAQAGTNTQREPTHNTQEEPTHRNQQPEGVNMLREPTHRGTNTQREPTHRGTNTQREPTHRGSQHTEGTNTQREPTHRRNQHTKGTNTQREPTHKGNQHTE